MLYDLPLASEVRTLFSAFAKPFAGRAPRVLFVNSVKTGREAAELPQLADIEAENVTYDRHWDLNKWGFGDFYDKRGDLGDARIMLRNVEEALCSNRHYDCIVLPAINGWNELTPATREAIRTRVVAGAGLVLVHPMEGNAEAEGVSLSDISPLLPAGSEAPYSRQWYDAMTRKEWVPRDHYITRGIPFGLLPYDRLCCSPYEAAGSVILQTADGEPVAAVKELGRGRVAAFGYYNRDFMPQHADYRGEDGCFNPITDTWLGAALPYGWNFMEAFYRLIARAIYWSAGFAPDGEIAGAEYEGGSLRIAHTGGGRLSARIWNRYGECIMDNRPVESVFELPEEVRQAGGTLRAELSLESEAGVWDFHTAVIALPAKADLAVKLSADECRNGDMLTAVVRLTGEADRLAVGLVDDYGRLLEVLTPELADVVTVSFKADAVLAGHVHAEAVALLAGTVAARARSADCIVAPQSRKLDDFEVFMNPQNRGQGDLLPYINLLFPQAGMTGSFVGDNRVTAMSGAHGLGVYWYNRKPYVENKERWLETGDKAYLVRKPCLNDEDFWQDNRIKIHENVERQKKYGPIAYFAQDEGSLTCYSDELDFCFCELCLTDMRVWLKEQYGSLEALNASWQTSCRDWAEAVPLTRAEARSKGVWTSWADHRRYMELIYTDAYRRMRTYIRERDPEGEVRMSGCQASTAYTGNDYDLLHEHVRYFEAYPVGGQYEFHRSFKHPDTILGGWFGYGSDGAAARHSVWNALFHGLTLCSIFWEYAFLNPDFTFSRSALDFGEVFREIRREGIGKLLLYAAEPDTLGIALHYSMASVHATNIAGHKTFFEENRTAWSELLEDSGAQYRYMSSRQIEDGALAGGVRLLILPCSMALSGKEAAEIEKFVKAGGVVLGDVQTGLYDEHCRRSDNGNGALDHLFGIKRLTAEWDPYSQDREYAIDPAFSFFDLDALSDEEGPGVPRVEPATRAAEGTRAFTDPFSGYGAALTVRHYGEGYGVYLNFAVQPYSRQRKESGKGSGLRSVLERILQFSGIVRPMSVSTAEGEPASGLESFYYSAGTAKIFGIKKEVGAAGIKYDGLAKNDQAASGDQESICVRFPEAGHLYDIRSKQYLGYCGEAYDELGDGEAKLYALLPYKARRLHLEAVGGSEFRAALEVDGTAPERTVFAVRVTRPDGGYCTLYSRNLIATGGSLVFSVPFALNEEGEWRVAVKDVLTGAGDELVVKRAALPPAVRLFNRQGVTP